MDDLIYGEAKIQEQVQAQIVPNVIKLREAESKFKSIGNND